jgi:hypothetical protein
MFSRKENAPQRLKPQLFAVIMDGLKAVPFNSLKSLTLMVQICGGRG